MQDVFCCSALVQQKFCQKTECHHELVSFAVCYFTNIQLPSRCTIGYRGRLIEITLVLQDDRVQVYDNSISIVYISLITQKRYCPPRHCHFFGGGFGEEGGGYNS